MTRVVWQPLPGSQALAVSCPVDVILYEGTRGPGKTDAQLMAFRRFVGLGYGEFWRGVIFDREYKNLDDLISKSKRWFAQFGDGAKFMSGTSALKWVWPTGEELLFRQAKKPADYDKFHGHEYPFIGWNELTKYPDAALFDAMMSTNRSSFRPEDYPLEDGTLLPEIPLRVMATTNPFGVGHHWVKRRFIDVAAPGQVVRNRMLVFNPRTKRREELVKTQVRIFGSYKENKYLSPEYVGVLESITDKNRRRAWLAGDWNITSGGALDDLWSESLHILPRFRIPHSWHVDRSFDWGSSHPFSVGWWAEANGEEATLPNGLKFCPPPGTLIRIAELYGSDEPGTNTGVKWKPSKVAQEIKRVDAELIDKGWVTGGIHAGPADNQIFDNQGRMDVESIATVMEGEGVYWERSDKSPGSRKRGLVLLRERLEAAIENEGPGLYVMRNCKNTIALLPSVPRDEEDLDDVNTASEDHIYDETRYRVLKGANRAATNINLSL